MFCRNFFICNLRSTLCKVKKSITSIPFITVHQLPLFLIISTYTVKLSPWNSGNMPTLLLALHCQLANLHTRIFCVCKRARPHITSNAAQHRSGSLTPFIYQYWHLACYCLCLHKSSNFTSILCPGMGISNLVLAG